MKQVITTLAIALLASSTAFAQVGELEDKKIGGNIGGETRDYLLQNGLTDQERAMLSSQQTAGNVTSIVQDGTSNIAIIQQVGVGNVTNLTQTGKNNKFESLIEGNNNLYLVNQDGDNNIVEHEIRGNNGEFRINQVGNGHVFRKSEIGTTPAVPVEITQQGQGMQITVTNGRVD